MNYNEFQIKIVKFYVNLINLGYGRNYVIEWSQAKLTKVKTEWSHQRLGKQI